MSSLSCSWDPRPVSGVHTVRRLTRELTVLSLGSTELNEFREMMTNRPHVVMDYFNISSALEDN